MDRHSGPWNSPAFVQVVETVQSATCWGPPCVSIDILNSLFYGPSRRHIGTSTSDLSDVTPPLTAALPYPYPSLSCIRSCNSSQPQHSPAKAVLRASTSVMGKAIKQTRAGATTAPRQSLAATHPSNYVQSASTKMPPPPAPTLARQKPASETAKAKLPSTTSSLNHSYPTPSPSPPEKLLDDSATPTKRASTASRTCPTPAGRSLLALNQPAQTSRAEQRGLARPWEQHNDPTVRHASPCECTKLMRT